MSLLSGLVGNRKGKEFFGGGVARGGTAHAGHGHWYSLLTPAVLRPSSVSNKPLNIVRPEDLVVKPSGKLGNPFRVPYAFGSSRRDTGDQPGQRHVDRFEDDVVFAPQPDSLELEDYDMVMNDETVGSRLQLDNNGHPIYDAIPVYHDEEPEFRIPSDSPLIDNYGELLQHMQRTVGVIADHPRARMPGSFPVSPVAGVRRERSPSPIERNVRQRTQVQVNRKRKRTSSDDSRNVRPRTEVFVNRKRKRNDAPFKRNVRQDKKLRINTRGLDASAQGSTGIIPSGIPTSRREARSRVVTESNIPDRSLRRQ